MNRLRQLLFALAASGLVAAAAACGPEPTKDGAGRPASSSSQPTNTQITAPLPDAAFRATLAPAEPPTRMRAGERGVVQVRVTNASQTAWPAMGEDSGKFAITLRNRWLAPGGERVVNDLDGGASLPYDVAPGAEVTMPIRVTAPKEAGEYVLEFDMVQEQVNFFRERGSTPARVNVRVE
jgi:hypothetical protein